MKKPKFPISGKRGSTVVKIYETPNKGFESFTLSYWSGGKRKRKTFSNLIEAKKEADRIAAIMTRGSDQNVLKLTSNDRAAYLRAVDSTHDIIVTRKLAPPIKRTSDVKRMPESID